MLQTEKPDVVFCLTPTDSLNVMAMNAEPQSAWGLLSTLPTVKMLLRF